VLRFCGADVTGVCWNLVHVAHLVNSKACTIIVPYCQDKERLPCLNMGVSYHSKIDACERKGDCWYTHAQPAHFRVNYRVTCDLGVHRAWRKRDLRNHYRNNPARGGNQVFGQRHTRPLGGSATTYSTRSSTHCARTVSNFLICGLFICVVWLHHF
jgi:hypothetical protein